MFLNGTLLSWLVGAPAVTGVLVLLLPRGRDRLMRRVALAGSVTTWALAMLAWGRFDPATAAIQLEERHAWIEAVGASYHIGIDGLSLVLIMLTTVLTPLAVLGSSWSIQTRLREFLAFMLLLETAMIGVFVALDLLLFYVFWELMVIPMALLIGVWGGPRRIYSSVKFFLYTMVGSVLMLVAILFTVWLGTSALGHPTFDLVELRGLVFAPGVERWLFLGFAIAFAIKVPLFPFHTWLPDAHVEAPTAGSVILAGVLLKMGTYGFLRFCMPLFPGAASSLAPLLVWIALIGIIYGALMALAQEDLKKLVAYSSVSHMGWVVLGLFVLNAAGVEGGLLQMVNHGVNTGALFLLVGMIYDRAHTRMLGDLGGVARVMPVFAAMALIFTLASIGLPGTGGFVGEFSILVGAFQSRALYGVIAALGVVLGAVYMLSMFRRVFFGAAGELVAGLRDIGGREIASLVPLAALVVWIGLRPGSWMEPARATLQALSSRIEAKVVAQEALWPRGELAASAGAPRVAIVRRPAAAAHPGAPAAATASVPLDPDGAPAARLAIAVAGATTAAAEDPAR